jgi:hypothetical protein
MNKKIDQNQLLRSLIVPPNQKISLKKDYAPNYKPDSVRAFWDNYSGLQAYEIHRRFV